VGLLERSDIKIGGHIVTFNPGDIVEITGPSRMSEWIGLRARVVSESSWTSSTRIELIGSRRPDGLGTQPFAWTTDGLVAAPPAPEELPEAHVFAVGDRVRVLQASHADDMIGSTGVIAALGDHVFELTILHPYLVQLDEGSNVYAARVELIEAAAPEQLPEAHVFAVGDRVRVLEAEGVYDDIGRTGVITRLRQDTTTDYGYDQPHPYRVRMDDGRNTWDVARVELIEAAPEQLPEAHVFAVGDRVRLTDDIGGDAEIGDLGTIEEVRSRRSFYIHFDRRQSGARGGGVHRVGSGQFELVGAATEPRPHPSGFAIGDRVRLTRTWSGVSAGSAGVVTRLDDYPPTFAVRFDDLMGGGYYGHGEYLVERYVFGAFARADGRPLPGRIGVGSSVVLKEVHEFSDNNKPAVTNYMAFGTVYTVREIDHEASVFRLDGVDGGWSPERFKFAPVEIAPEAAPEPDPVSA
jgi:hypothetical protein